MAILVQLLLCLRIPLAKRLIKVFPPCLSPSAILQQLEAAVKEMLKTVKD